jgi:hypothetical protein
MTALGAIGHPINDLISKRGSPSRFDHMRRKRFYMYGRQLRFPFLLCCALCVFAFPANSQILQEETLSGPDSHETGQGPHGHLFGNWGGERTHLLERGVRFDFQYVSDSLWNLKSEQKERFASWNRFRGTVDIDFGTLIGQKGLYFHATALWQGGGNLGAYLGLLTSPSGMSSANTCRLDSWWIEKRWLDERITARVGQFAGQDFYGTQHYAASFIFEQGLCLGQFICDLRVLRPTLDASDGNPRRTAPQPLCEIDGAGRGPLAFFTKSNRPGSAVQWNSNERFGDWVYSGQEGVVGAGL